MLYNIDLDIVFDVAVDVYYVKFVPQLLGVSVDVFVTQMLPSPVVKVESCCGCVCDPNVTLPVVKIESCCGCVCAPNVTLPCG